MTLSIFMSILGIVCWLIIGYINIIRNKEKNVKKSQYIFAWTLLMIFYINFTFFT